MNTDYIILNVDKYYRPQKKVFHKIILLLLLAHLKLQGLFMAQSSLPKYAYTVYFLFSLHVCLN